MTNDHKAPQATPTCCHHDHGHAGADHGSTAETAAAQAPPDARYFCPMCPGVYAAEPGSCPKCGMALEPLDPTAAADDGEYRDMRWRFQLAALLTLPVLWLAMGGMLPGPDPRALLGHTAANWAELLFATPVVLWAGWPFLQRGWQSLRSRSANMFTLILLGTGAAWLYSVVAVVLPTQLPAPFRGDDGYVPLYFEAAAVIVTLVLLGQMLELRARKRTSGALRALLELTPPIAHRLDADGRESDVALAEVAVGDRLRVRPGENLPVDGEVLEGDSHVDEAMLTGEAEAPRKQPGAAVTAGTRNGTGSLLIRAERIGNDTVVAQIVRRVAEAQRSRAPVQRIVDRVAGMFVPAVVLVAIMAFATWALIGPEPRLATALLVAVSVLIVACPCALGLATPMSIMVGVGRGAEHGVLIRDAEALERLQQVDTLLVDKTGTLTEGQPRLQAVEPNTGWSEDALLRAAAAVEMHSEHPLARAVVDAIAERGLEAPQAAADFGSDPGLGVWGTVAGQRVAIGNPRLMAREGVASPRDTAAQARSGGATVVHIAVDGCDAGSLVINDRIKPSTPEAVRALRAAGLRVIMVTGDSAATAQAVADTLGLDGVHAGVLPADKADIVQQLQAQGHVVAMAGDGTNDAPALAAADVGIAMGSGTDVAMQSAGVTLVRGDLRGIVRAITLSRATLRNIRQNLFFAFIYNAVGVPVAAGVLYPLTGLLLSPMFAAAAMSLSSVSVVGNALRLRAVRL